MLKAAWHVVLLAVMLAGTHQSNADKPMPENLPELKAGDHVMHEQFGEGVVISCQPVKNDAEVVVAFDGTGIKKLLLSFAKLEKV